MLFNLSISRAAIQQKGNSGAQGPAQAQAASSGINDNAFGGNFTHLMDLGPLTEAQMELIAGPAGSFKKSHTNKCNVADKNDQQQREQLQQQGASLGWTSLWQFGLTILAEPLAMSVTTSRLLRPLCVPALGKPLLQQILRMPLAEMFQAIAQFQSKAIAHTLIGAP